MSHSPKRGGDKLLRFKGRLGLPDFDNLIGQIFKEPHRSRYSVHLGSTKMYYHLQEVYGWDGLKSNISEFVARCPTFKQVKAKNQNSGGLNQVMNVPTWKLEYIYIYFVVELPPNRRQNDLILIIVDRLMKSSHFIPVKSTYLTEEYARIYLKEIVSIHGSLCTSSRVKVLIRFSFLEVFLERVR